MEKESLVLTIKLVGEEHPKMEFEFSEFYKEMFAGHEDMTEAGFKVIKDVMDRMLVIAGLQMMVKGLKGDK